MEFSSRLATPAGCWGLGWESVPGPYGTRCRCL